MPATMATLAHTNPLLLFVRLWDDASRSMTPTVARHLLKLGFTDEDKARMHELAAKNSEGRISPTEVQELDSFVEVGDLIGILHSRARIILKKNTKTK